MCISFSSDSGALFGRVEHFAGGSIYGFLVCVAVYDAGGAWSAFCPLAWVVSGFGPFALVIFDGHVWGLFLLRVMLTAVLAWTRGTRTSRLLYLFNNLLFLDFRTSASKPDMLYNLGEQWETVYGVSKP